MKYKQDSRLKRILEQAAAMAAYSRKPHMFESHARIREIAKKIGELLDEESCGVFLFTLGNQAGFPLEGDGSSGFVWMWKTGDGDMPAVTAPPELGTVADHGHNWRSAAYQFKADEDRLDVVLSGARDLMMKLLEA